MPADLSVSEKGRLRGRAGLQSGTRSVRSGTSPIAYPRNPAVRQGTGGPESNRVWVPSQSWLSLVGNPYRRGSGHSAAAVTPRLPTPRVITPKGSTVILLYHIYGFGTFPRPLQSMQSAFLVPQKPPDSRLYGSSPLPRHRWHVVMRTFPFPPQVLQVWYFRCVPKFLPRWAEFRYSIEVEPLPLHIGHFSLKSNHPMLVLLYYSAMLHSYGEVALGQLSHNYVWWRYFFLSVSVSPLRLNPYELSL